MDITRSDHRQVADRIATVECYWTLSKPALGPRSRPSGLEVDPGEPGRDARRPDRGRGPARRRVGDGQEQPRDGAAAGLGVDVERAVYTIGHSNHPLTRFLQLLRVHRIDAIGDVRSAPYSRRHPWFGREALQRALHAHGIAYVFLGASLGARPSDPECTRDGRVSFARLAETPTFRAGLDRVLRGCASHRLALLCAEKEPLEWCSATSWARPSARS